MQTDQDELLPGEQLVGKLEELRLFLQNFIVRLDDSGVRRTAGLLEWKGRTCGYYWKSLDLFLRADYQDLKTLILEAADLIKQCEEQDVE